MTSATTSIYSAFVDHNAELITRRARDARAKGQFLAWGHDDHTVEEAAADMGAVVLGSHDDGLLCELSDRLYLLGDDGGPCAVEVATQADLSA